MNRQLHMVFWFILTCWILSSCANPRTFATEISPSPVLKKTITATATNQPIQTQTPFMFVLPSLTMSPQESENALLELLKTNGNCKGKCLAGIRPDEMEVQEAVNTMSQWGMIRMGENSQGKVFFNLEPNTLYGNVAVYLSMGTWTKEYQSVDTIIFRLQSLSEQYISSDLWLENREKWEGFDLSNLIKAYGMPTYVGYFFQTTVDPEASLVGRTISYSIEIQYKQIDLLVGIGALAYYDGSDLFLCPSKDPHDLGVVIKPERSLMDRQIFYPVTWQALTDTNLEAFYSMFTDEANPDACITTTLEQIQQLQPSFR